MSEDKQVSGQAVETPAAEEKLSDMDRMALELVKSKEAGARAAYEATALATRNVVLQLFMKYKLNETDVIKDDGTIVKGGATTTVQ